MNLAFIIICVRHLSLNARMCTDWGIYTDSEKIFVLLNEKEIMT